MWEFHFWNSFKIKSDKENIDELYELIKSLKSENMKLSEEKKEMEKNLTNEIKRLKEEIEKIKNKKWK